MEHADDFIWRGDGDEAEIVVHAPDPKRASRAFERALAVARIPGAGSPVCAVASSDGYGHVVSSSSHVAPELASIPERGFLLSTGVFAGSLERAFGVPLREVVDEAPRRIRDARSSLPRLDAAGVRRVCGVGAFAAAEDGLIAEEDLPFFGVLPGEPDSLERRAVSGGERDWPELFGLTISPCVVGETFDAERVEELGLEPGMFVISARITAGDLGRLAFASHDERISDRLENGVFDPAGDLRAAPLDTEEASEFLAASGSVANFADGRAALCLHVLRRALAGTVGEMDVLAAWRIGGATGSSLHRSGLAALGRGEVFVCGPERAEGGEVCVGTGTMYASGPPFGVRERDGRWPWEEAGLVERLARLERPGGEE